MLRRLSAFLLFVTIGFVAGMVITGRMRSADEASAVQPEAAPLPQGRPSVGGSQPLADLTTIAERAVSAVTSITSTSTIRTRPSEMFRFLYGDQMFERQAQSLGSGVIVSRDGYVLTNFHVIDSGGSRPEVSVILADKREFAAKIIGLDPELDLAVLKIQATNLPTIGWGDSSKLRIAEWVLAIGNPFGVFSQTVTLGIVSATSRNVEGLSYEDFIQTDAAINRGNSGGALINARGELVGINSAIYSETGGYQGIGLAIPGNLARRMMDVMIKDGVVRRGTIYGLQFAAMTTQIAEEVGAPDTRGVLVTAVDRRSRAAAAGLERYDIILSLNGRDIESAQQFLRMLAETDIGSTATLVVLREGRRVTVRVPIEEAQPRRRR